MRTRARGVTSVMTICKYCKAEYSITENGVRDEYVWRELNGEWESSLDYGEISSEGFQCEDCGKTAFTLESLTE